MILVFLALLIILKFNSPAVYLDYLIGLVLLLLVASAAFALWVFFSLHLEVDTQAAYVHVGDDIHLTVRVISPELCGKLRAAVKLSNLQRGESSTEKRLLSRHRSELSFKAEETGTIELSIPYVEVFGMFGVLRLKRRRAFSTRINVYPNAGPSPDRYVRLSHVPGGGETQNNKGDDYSDIYDVRPLQEGDDLRYVHRQLSAKYDEYIIKVGSDSRRHVYNYYVENGLDFPEMSVRVAQMITLRRTLDREEGAMMAATYRNRTFVIGTDSQLYELADRIYEDYLPEKAGAAGGAK